MGTSAFYLVWKKPAQQNGIITGYNIYYRVVNGMQLEALLPRVPQIHDSNRLSAKLSGLKSDTKYRIHVRATTRAGEGDDYFIEQKTRPSGATQPDVPRFSWHRQPTENGLATIKVVWHVSADEKPGSHFFVKYRKKGEPDYQKTQEEINEDYMEVRGLYPNEVYEFRVVAVDGDLYSESPPQDVDTYVVEGPIIQPRENVATAGWFIGMMLAIAFLLLVLIIVCIIKRNRGGKYAVHEREQANGRHDYPEEGGFHEYSQPLDNKSHGRASMGSEPKLGAESDTDSMAEYGEGDTGMHIFYICC